MSSSNPSPQQESLYNDAVAQLLPFSYNSTIRPVGLPIDIFARFPASVKEQLIAKSIAEGKPLSLPIAANPKLFEPLTIRSVTFKNRIFVSPMCMYSSKDGLLSDYHLVHLGKFAQYGAGLVFVEATAVTSNGRISPHDAGMWDDKHIAPAKRIVDFIHANHCVAGIQLAHAGRKASTKNIHFMIPGYTKNEVADLSEGGWPDDVWGPSTVPFHSSYPNPKELSIEQIKQVIESFVDASKRAVQAGFDVIEVHAAHGYLLSSFCSSNPNKRTDQYGGSFENRTRLILEVATAIRAVLPDGMPLFFRISCHEWVEDGGWDMEQTLALAPLLIAAGVDMIDCSSGAISHHQKIKVEPAYQVQFSDGIKKKYGDSIKTIAVGQIREPKQAEQIIASGQADAVNIARQFLREPSWVIRAARELGAQIAMPIQYQYFMQDIPSGF